MTFCESGVRERTKKYDTQLITPHREIYILEIQPYYAQWIPNELTWDAKHIVWHYYIAWGKTLQPTY